MCRAHATVRGLLGEIVARAAPGRDVVVDMEAGLEHIARGTGRHVSSFLAVLEPYFRSMETVRRTVELTRDLGIERVRVVANKVRDPGDRAAIADFCAAHGLELWGEVPYDPKLPEAERHGRCPIDYDPGTPGVAAIRAMAGSLLAEDGDGSS